MPIGTRSAGAAGRYRVDGRFCLCATTSARPR